jgi:hypothetical protein
MSIDMAAFVIPKSDQLNADDLIAGPRTVRIERVSGSGNPDQPVNVHFEGDGGKPFRPCKSMRRVMIAAWGADAAQYPGRSMTLYRDPKVAFGGMEVGGIRISHMTHIERDLNMALTVTKAKRQPYRVQVLKEAPPAAPAKKAVDAKTLDSARAWAEIFVAQIKAAPDAAAVTALLSGAEVRKRRDWIAENLPESSVAIEAALDAAPPPGADTLAGDNDGFPGDAG